MRKVNSETSPHIPEGEKIVLECSSCNKPLVDVRTTNPEQPFVWKVRAKCCYCGDTSFEKEVHGLLRYFGAQAAKEEDSSDVVLLTRIAHLEADGDKVIFHTAPGDKS
jgi:hypothetical protein